MAAVLDVLTLVEGKAALNLAGTSQYDGEIPVWITATSLALDAKVGPIVKRTVTDEFHDGRGSYFYTRLYPVLTFTTVTEYNGTTATVLSVETNASKPSPGYLAEQYEPNPALLSGRIRRRGSGFDAWFPEGSGNIVVTYVAGRFEDTAAVDERFKSAARLTLQNLWNSQRPNLGDVGEFEVPQSNWPRFAIPNAVRQMLANEWQDAPRAL